MIKKILTISFCLCTASFAWAQQSSIDAEPSRSLPFLEINPDVRTAGMGDANMGNTKSMYLYTNPSAFLLNHEDIYAGYTFGMYPKVDNGRTMLHTASAGYRFHENHAIMLGARYFALPKINELSSTGGITGKTFKPYDMSIDLSYAIRFADKFSAFISGEFIKSDISKTAQTGGVSLGIYYNNYTKSSKNCLNYSIGLDLKDLGGNIKYSGSTNEGKMPTSVGLGGSLAFQFAENHAVGAAVSARYFMLPSDAAEFTVGVGAEYDFMNMLAVRAGYHIGDKNNYVTAGLGFKYDYVGIDAAYCIATVKEFNLLRLGLSLYF